MSESTQKNDPVTLRVRSTSNSGALAGAIKKTHDSNPDQQIILRFIGAGCANQALKSVVVLNTFLSKEGKCCHIFPSMVLGENQDTTVMEFSLKFTRL